MAKKFSVKNIKTLVIDRSKWQRLSPEVENFQNEGKLSVIDEELLPCVHASVLYDINHKRMCCLGFYCEKAGFSKSKMSGQSVPFSLIKKYNKLPKLVDTIKHGGEEDEFIDNDLTEKLIDINDNNKLSDSEKQKRITKEFAKIGVKVKFIGPTIREEIEAVRQKIASREHSVFIQTDKSKKK